MKKILHSLYRNLLPLLWDLWCLVSIIGIWPRFIEPNLLSVSKIRIKIPGLPPDLNGLKIIQFSDLHLYPKTPIPFLKKIIKKISNQNPDLILFTGDFLCYSVLNEEKKLNEFLNCLHAKYGCYAILGNHDYSSCVSINPEGDYDVIENNKPHLSKAFGRLFTKTTLTKHVTDKAKAIPFNKKLLKLLEKTPFKLLHNETAMIPIKNSYLNICGLGEYIMGRFQPEEAFKNYSMKYPGIILAHNPDTIPHLKKYPGEMIFCGHTHGGQVNLPWLWKKFTLLENMQFKKGLLKVDNKWAYINRGIGSVLPFRWFSPPEILMLTLE